MLKWLDSTEAVAQADSAIEEVGRIVPLAQLTDASTSRSKQMQKLERTIDKHRRQYAGYNIYQKAKFANRVKWCLRDRNYPNEFIDSLVRLLII